MAGLDRLVLEGPDFEGPALYGEDPHDADDNLSTDDTPSSDNDPSEDFDDADCGLMNNGSCSMAGSEFCDFECPNRD